MADSQLPRARRILTGIDSSTWEHPADRAALMALRRVPAFDTVLKKVFGLFGEKPIRLAFQSNAVRVSENQFPWIWERYVEVCETLDAPRYELFVSQTPLVNAGAYGMEKPFIVLNSGAVRLLDREELTWLLGHELGHIMSGHVLYRTMTVLLLQLAQLGFPVVGLAARAVLVALLEWNRKAELSSDRAGLLAVQNPEATLKGFMKLAGGGSDEETNLNEFLVQAEEYRTSGDAADLVFKVLNLLGTTHPFHVLRAAEIRDWIEAGEYDRVLRGEYRRRGEAYEPWRQDVAEAARSYREDAQDLARQFGDALRSARERFSESFRAAP
ncbi:MAG TPA: M48 family metallopeptidase [Longimicrobiales bacterium]|nr:M48 family metallopeptidase [Longimicrobiales bacterium]